MNNSSNFIEVIDNDAGLQSQRKLLTVVSLILLALSFSGAMISEANTFIFKIKFSHQNGLGILLVLSIIFLMIRYYNYAKIYHRKLYSLWTGRLLNHPFFYHDHHLTCPEVYGLVGESRPDEYFLYFGNAGLHWTYSYECRWGFRRYIVHRWEDKKSKGYRSGVKSINILIRFGKRRYLRSIYLEAIEQSKSLLTHRENLDILAPYMLGSFAIASYYFNAELMDLLLFLTP